MSSIISSSGILFVQQEKIKVFNFLTILNKFMRASLGKESYLLLFSIDTSSMSEHCNKLYRHRLLFDLLIGLILTFYLCDEDFD